MDVEGLCIDGVSRALRTVGPKAVFERVIEIKRIATHPGRILTGSDGERTILDQGVASHLLATKTYRF